MYDLKENWLKHVLNNIINCLDVFKRGNAEKLHVTFLRVIEAWLQKIISLFSLLDQLALNSKKHSNTKAPLCRGPLRVTDADFRLPRPFYFIIPEFPARRAPAWCSEAGAHRGPTCATSQQSAWTGSQGFYQQNPTHPTAHQHTLSLFIFSTVYS